MVDTFFNTTNQTGNELNESVKQAKKQNEIVLDFFKTNSDKDFTPYEVWKKVFTHKTPITSIRRSITTLTAENKLKQLSIQRKGGFGKANYCWKYCPTPDEVILQNKFEKSIMPSGNTIEKK